MKIVIDIPQGLKIDFENENWTALTCAEMKNALMNGTVVNDDEWMKKADNIAKLHKRDALNEVRAEIESHIGGCGYLNDGLDLAIQIIDKHLGKVTGKEK